MEKILIALDNRILHRSTIEFAVYLSILTHSRLSGVFLNNVVVEEEVLVNEIEDGADIFQTISLKEVVHDDGNIKAENLMLFERLTLEAGIEPYIEFDEGIPAIDLPKITRFADLLIIDSTTFSGMYDGVPTRFVKDILQDGECPVIIAPGEFAGIDNIIFCYNGMKSSVFAIKQFNYLFPELEDNRAKVLYLNTPYQPSSQEENAITEWLQYHYKDVEFIDIAVDATADAFYEYLLGKHNDFIVMGPYGRGFLDSFFESADEGQGRLASLPIFISYY